MSGKVVPIPEGFFGVTPHLVVKGAAKAIEFYKKAFGAVEVVAMPVPGTDMLMHAELDLAGARLMLVDEMPEMGMAAPVADQPKAITLHFYTEDVDAVIKAAQLAGAEILMPPQDMFWGDRYARLRDPFGHDWSVATHISEPTPEEMQAAMAAMMSQNCGE